MKFFIRLVVESPAYGSEAEAFHAEIGGMLDEGVHRCFVMSFSVPRLRIGSGARHLHTVRGAQHGLKANTSVISFGESKSAVQRSKQFARHWSRVKGAGDRSASTRAHSSARSAARMSEYRLSPAEELDGKHLEVHAPRVGT
jgi:hypothetical protein